MLWRLQYTTKDGNSFVKMYALDLSSNCTHRLLKNDIVRSGLVPNKDKSIWKPSQTIK
jgi:hypothetical protein